jgi:hypothetical protein
LYKLFIDTDADAIIADDDVVIRDAYVVTRYAYVAGNADVIDVAYVVIRHDDALVRDDARDEYLDCSAGG